MTTLTPAQHATIKLHALVRRLIDQSAEHGRSLRQSAADALVATELEIYKHFEAVLAVHKAQLAELEADVALLRPVYEATHGLCYGEDWNNGTHAKLHGYRAKLIAAVNAARAKFHPLAPAKEPRSGAHAGLPPNLSPRWRHVKRGSEYTLLGYGKMQTLLWNDGTHSVNDYDSGPMPVDMRPVAIYRGDDGQLWVRPREEFEDGRFIPALPSSPQPEPQP